MLLFRKMVVIVACSNKLRKIILTNSVVLAVQEMLRSESVKNSYKLNSLSRLKDQGCGNEILESSISL